MTSVKPFMMALSCGVALFGTIVYGGYDDRQARNQHAAPQPTHEAAVKPEARPRGEGHIVDHRELRLLHPDMRTFERFVMPEGFEELAP